MSSVVLCFTKDGYNQNSSGEVYIPFCNDCNQTVITDEEFKNKTLNFEYEPDTSLNKTNDTMMIIFIVLCVYVVVVLIIVFFNGCIQYKRHMNREYSVQDELTHFPYSNA